MQDNRRAKRDAAKDIIRSMLADGPVSGNEVLANLGKLGISRGTIQNAKRDLGVVCTTNPLKNYNWTWTMTPESTEISGHPGA